MSVCMYVFIDGVCVYVYIYIYIYRGVCVYIYIYIQAHVYIHSIDMRVCVSIMYNTCVYM